ncbi:MAG: hypothetical protein KAH11_03550 [Rhodospirillales bacterium]|jgi:hypothetical protein|nr:hypothetical protein [Rhodospirillales bacterium]
MTFEKRSSYYLNEPWADSPPGVGPHELRELELMLAGTKPLAMFYDVVPASIELPEADFDPFVEAGRIVKRVCFFRDKRHGFDHRYLFYALPGEEWRIDEMYAFKESLFSGSYRFNPEDERRIGQLLGYDDQDIESYIAHALNNRPSIK